MPPQDKAQLKLVVGLGNPGEEYAATRHNVGFMVVDQLLGAMVHVAGEPRHFADSYIWQARFAGRTMLLQKPFTYMNLSGKAVARLCREQQLLPSEILVVSDDIALPLGRLRFRKKGGDGGHNGLANIIDQLGTSAFNRLRVGIGHNSDDNSDTETNSELVDFVLGPFSAAEQERLPPVLSAAAEAVKTAFRRGVVPAMNAYNGLQIESATNKDDKSEETIP